MADFTTIRAEIKHWERSFKENNGRPPTVEDIKNNAQIAEKYKLYKRLNKAATSSGQSQYQQNTSIPSPSTPPRKTRPKDPPSILLSRTRQVEPTAPLASFNPFSPQKKQKGKEKATYKQPNPESPRPNLFQKLRPQVTSPGPFARLPSDAVLPAASQLNPSSSASSSDVSAKTAVGPPNAVIRARKRLRGEPVSPSPSKDKRRRVASQTIIPFPRMQLKAATNEQDDEDEDMAVDADTSFVDESPMKQPSGKSFSMLFEDKIPQLDLFGIRNDLGLGDASITSRSDPTTHAQSQRPTVHGSGASTLQKGKDKAEEMEGLENLNLSTASSAKSDTGSQSTSRSSTKRPLSPEDAEVRPVPRARSPLIPPSPPPSTSTTSFNQPGKRGKGGAKNRKRPTVAGDSASHDSDDESVKTLKIVKRNPPRPRHAADEDEAELNSDPILAFSRTAVPHASPPVNFQQDDGHVEIDLPEKLRHVLALQPAASHNSEEDRLVKSLLYNRKTTWYDPNKGGEIWDIGEDHNITSVDETNRYTDGEDDWEGEPVPWEVGEL
ncbi:DNA replication and checkpoint protein-domain-containing protein [Panaeolus papilionaceus]|nr:DNA replication and checkpoint protein-domain-containing protein [Panaeolus papilionaceus]